MVTDLEYQARLLRGKVVSDVMDKTVSVEMIRKIKHPLVKKYYKRTSVYFVHDEKNEAKIGDFIFFYQTRPISKKKTFKLHSIER